MARYEDSATEKGFWNQVSQAGNGKRAHVSTAFACRSLGGSGSLIEKRASVPLQGGGCFETLANQKTLDNNVAE